MKNEESKTFFALIDCNNFFVSCERIFRPDLANRPVIVLSSGDGCVVSRSNEAKRLGIPMGAPAFKIRDLLDKRPMHLPQSARLDAAPGSKTGSAGQEEKAAGGAVIQFSGNFELYSDISRRIISVLASVNPRLEVYSIDESFMDLSQLGIRDYTDWGRELAERVWRAVGVPVSVGIAPSKTLAKLAADHAKKRLQTSTFSLQGATLLQGGTLQNVLSQMPVEDVWGVGRRLAPRLRAEGIGNALDLAQLHPARAHQLMGINGVRLVAELNGQDCYGFKASKPQQSIMRGRTFGEDTGKLSVLEAAVASLTSRAAFHLRQEGSLATAASLYLSTNGHKPGTRAWHQAVRLAAPTSDSGRLINALVSSLQSVYRPSQPYHRAVVTLHDLLPARFLQTDFFGRVQPTLHERETARMAAVDTINNRFGRGRIYYASEDLGKSWQPQRRLGSPRYTTAWLDLPEAFIAEG